jgi:hypothetical protein
VTSPQTKNAESQNRTSNSSLLALASTATGAGSFSTHIQESLLGFKQANEIRAMKSLFTQFNKIVLC